MKQYSSLDFPLLLSYWRKMHALAELKKKYKTLIVCKYFMPWLQNCNTLGNRMNKDLKFFFSFIFLLMINNSLLQV